MALGGGLRSIAWAFKTKKASHRISCHHKNPRDPAHSIPCLRIKTTAEIPPPSAGADPGLAIRKLGLRQPLEVGGSLRWRRDSRDFSLEKRNHRQPPAIRTSRGDPMILLLLSIRQSGDHTPLPAMGPMFWTSCSARARRDRPNDSR